MLIRKCSEETSGRSEFQAAAARRSLSDSVTDPTRHDGSAVPGGVATTSAKPRPPETIDPAANGPGPGSQTNLDLCRCQSDDLATDNPRRQ
jgi:hypothetical protein